MKVVGNSPPPVLLLVRKRERHALVVILGTDGPSQKGDGSRTPQQATPNPASSCVHRTYIHALIHIALTQPCAGARDGWKVASRGWGMDNA
jgi:hypothetical protein